MRSMTRKPDPAASARGQPAGGRAGPRALLALVAVATLLSAGCGEKTKAPPAAPDAQVSGDTIVFPPGSAQLTSLRVVEVVADRESSVRINGRTTWDESMTSRVTSPVAGRVVSVAAAPGATVRKGETLAVISSPEFGASQAEARKADTELEQAARALARSRELYSAGVIPQKDLQAAESDFARARSERDRTGARERLYGGSGVIDQQYRLTAPLAGVVVVRNLTVGQEVRPEQPADQPLFVISNPSQLWINLEVPEILSGEVQLGEIVRITVPALPGEVFEARVDYVADFIDPQTRTVKARATVTNPNRRLKAEMFITAEVEIPPTLASRVPASSVVLIDKDYYTFVETEPGTFVRRPVRAEEGTLGFFRVTKGLQPGERVVADGALLLQRLISQRAASPDAPADAPKAGAAGK